MIVAFITSAPFFFTMQERSNFLALCYNRDERVSKQRGVELIDLVILWLNLKNLSGGLYLCRGLNMVGST